MGALPRRAVAVALVAFANAIAWGLITPPFQVPDEPSHFYYVAYLAQTGELPHAPTKPDPEGKTWYSPQVTGLLTEQQFYFVIGHAGNRPPTGEAAQRLRAGIVRQHLGARGVGNAVSATTNPPLYYLAEAVPYEITSAASPLDQLMAMRVVSALMGALTVLFTFLFLRELLPRSPWAWTVGALVAAFEPMFGFITGGVNNDAALYLGSAALLALIARLLRRGPSVRRLVLTGLVLGLGVLVKTQMLAFAPAAVLAAGISWWRVGERSVPRAVRAVRAVAIPVAAALVPLAVYFVLGHTVWQRPLVDRVGQLGAATPKPFEIREFLSYGWQLYLPRLPFLQDLYPGVAPYHLWFRGLVGNFGWLDYEYPSWVYGVVLVLTAAVVVLALRALVSERAALWRRAGDVVVYVLFAAGLAGAVAVAGYRSEVLQGIPFQQARYLLPLLPLFAGVVALAVRGAGRRFAAPIGAGAVLVVVALDVYAQLLTLGRYYG